MGWGYFTGMKAIEIESVVCDGTALIVLHPTGIKYTAQCGGMGCTHPEAEGYVFGLGKFMQDFDTCEFGCHYMDRDVKYRNALRDAVNQYCQDNPPFGNWIRFDDSRINEAQEGWIPVVLNGSFGFPEITFNGERGFIHNFNCD
jgi:hypothetical protein